LAIVVLSLNAAFALSFISNGLNNKPIYITPYRDPLGSFSNSDNISSTGYNITGALSFILIWLATVLLLRHYSARIGKVKYWLIVSAPLIYFLSQFQGIFVDSFQQFSLDSPFMYHITLTLIFNSVNVVGGILFGVAFWIMARNISNTSVKKYLTLSGIGIMLLFGARQAISLISAPYPPFGTVTTFFSGLASYLIFIGIFYSALSVAKDRDLRYNIAKSIRQESKLLHSIGTSEMEEEYIKRVWKFQKLFEKSDQEVIQISMDSNDIKKYIKEIIAEVRKNDPDAKA